ncbi:MAG: prepilin-type N-terminal cleavage/methylation domain-containing protein [Thermovirgaceae bacterium]|nr:prepilin-type N-terminal cleavage/methylation domain-containing protein [Thermovirgaceae bacterium]
MAQWMKKRKSRGFTLVELLIVIVIIGILAGSLLLVMGSGTDKANATKVVSDMRTLKAAQLMYYADNDEFATDIDDLTTYVDRTPDGGALGEYSATATSIVFTADDTGGGFQSRLDAMAPAAGVVKSGDIYSMSL